MDGTTEIRQHQWVYNGVRRRVPMDTMRRSITWSRVVVLFLVLLLLFAIQTFFYPEPFIFWSSVVILSVCVRAAQSRAAKITSAALLSMALAGSVSYLARDCRNRQLRALGDAQYY